MNKKLFMEYFLARGYKVMEITAYGVENGYPVAVSLMQNRVLTAQLSVWIDDPKPAVKELKKEYGKKNNLSYNKGILSMIVRTGKNDYDNEFRQAISQITQLLAAKGHKPLDICPVCGQGECDTLVAMNGYAPIHRRCLDSMVSQVHQKVEKNELSGSYITGFIGALIGAVIGVLPSLLTIIWNDTIYAVLFALIPLCIYQGYKICKGKMNRSVIILTIILTLISVYLLVILLAAYQLVAEYGIPINMAVSGIMELLMIGQTWIDMTMDSLICFLFAALGIWFAWGKISQTSETDIENISDSMGTAVPYAVHGIWGSEDRNRQINQE